MEINLPRVLENDIKSFCKLNEINDIDAFLITCLRNGYNIVKYGTSPKENFNNENKPLSIESYDTEKVDVKAVEGEPKKKPGRPKKQPTNSEEISKSIEEKEEPIKPKRKIRIIKD